MSLLTPDDVDAIAERVAELLRDDLPSAGVVDTAAAARFLSVGEDWVREHAAELGASRLGDSGRGELRFDVGDLRSYLEARRVRRGQEPPPPAGPAARTSRTVRLLPLPAGARR